MSEIQDNVKIRPWKQWPAIGITSTTFSKSAVCLKNREAAGDDLPRVNGSSHVTKSVNWFQYEIVIEPETLQRKLTCTLWVIRSDERMSVLYVIAPMNEQVKALPVRSKKSKLEDAYASNLLLDYVQSWTRWYHRRAMVLFRFSCSFSTGEAVVVLSRELDCELMYERDCNHDTSTGFRVTSSEWATWACMSSRITSWPSFGSNMMNSASSFSR